MYLLCSWYRCLRPRIVCPTYDSLHVLHVSFYNPQIFCSFMLLVVLGLVRYCIVLVLLKDILTFVCLNEFVILRISGL